MRQVIFSGDLLRQISSEKNINLFSFIPISPSLTWLYSPHINFKFERARIETLLRELSIIKRLLPYQKGFLFLVGSFENIYNKTTELKGQEEGFCRPKDLGSSSISAPS